MPEYEYTVNYLQEIPEDTVIVAYRNVNDLTWFVNALIKTSHIFVVHPGKQQIAFAKAALTDIEGMV